MIHCFKICKEQFAAIDCEDQRFICIKENQDIGIGDNLVLLEYDKGQKNLLKSLVGGRSSIHITNKQSHNIINKKGV